MRGDIVLAACWAHTRRKFYDVHEATGSPIAAEALRRIAELYAIETSVRGRTAEQRRHVRDASSRLLLDAMKPWLQTEVARIPGRSALAEAIRYALARWEALCLFLGAAASSSTTIRSSARSDPSHSAARTISLQDPTAAASAGPPSALSSPPLNSTTSSRSPTSNDVLERLSNGYPMRMMCNHATLTKGPFLTYLFAWAATAICSHRQFCRWRTRWRTRSYAECVMAGPSGGRITRRGAVAI